MPRSLLLLLLLVLLLIGAMLFLSTQASEVPTRTIEADPVEAPNAA